MMTARRRRRRDDPDDDLAAWIELHGAGRDGDRLRIALPLPASLRLPIPPAGMATFRHAGGRRYEADPASIREPKGNP